MLVNSVTRFFETHLRAVWEEEAIGRSQQNAGHEPLGGNVLSSSLSPQFYHATRELKDAAQSLLAVPTEIFQVQRGKISGKKQLFMHATSRVLPSRRSHATGNSPNPEDF